MDEYDSKTRQRMDQYIQFLWAQSGLDNNGEELPAGVARRRYQYSPSVVESDSIFDVGLNPVNTSASTPARIGEAGMARAFERYRDEEDMALSPISMADALSGTSQMEFMMV